MNPIDKATIIHYHRHRIASFEDGTVEALGWRNAESQSIRFDILSSITDLNGASILDAGCGYGDLASHLNKRFHSFYYLGVDQVPEFIIEGCKRYSQLDHIQLLEGDFSCMAFPQVDYVFACGALSYRSKNKNCHKEIIEYLYTTAERAFAFTMLNNRVFPDHPLLVGFDPQDIKSFCDTLSSHVELINTYLPDDFTVVMRKSL